LSPQYSQINYPEVLPAAPCGYSSNHNGAKCGITARKRANNRICLFTIELYRPVTANGSGSQTITDTPTRLIPEDSEKKL
jgi:hypothetical protein